MFSFLYYCQDAYRTWLCISVTQRCHIRRRDSLPFASTWVHPRFWVGSVLLIFVVFLCCPIMYIYVLTSLFWCPLRLPHASVRFYLQLCVGGFMSYLGYLCLFANRVVQHILSVFLLSFSSPCIPYIAIFSGLSICIAPSVFSNGYFCNFFNTNRCSQRPLIVGNPQLIRVLSNHHTWGNWQRNPRFVEKTSTNSYQSNSLFNFVNLLLSCETLIQKNVRSHLITVQLCFN